jgi:hypothetical protein
MVRCSALGKLGRHKSVLPAAALRPEEVTKTHPIWGGCHYGCSPRFHLGDPPPGLGHPGSLGMRALQGAEETCAKPTGNLVRHRLGDEAAAIACEPVDALDEGAGECIAI